jgi:hypothetical protein
MPVSDFRSRLVAELRAEGLLGRAAERTACAEHARIVGESVLAEIEGLAGARSTRRALASRRGPEYAATYRHVAGYGALMTEFLVAPVALSSEHRERIARIGAIANVIVSHFDEMVDGGWPRALLLP